MTAWVDGVDNEVWIASLFARNDGLARCQRTKSKVIANPPFRHCENNKCVIASHNA